MKKIREEKEKNATAEWRTGKAAERETEGKEKIKRTAIYCRVSTLNDLQDGSFETQKEYYLQLVQSRPDMVLAGIYGDQGKSGRCIKGRPQFKKMLEDCKEGKIDLILTKSISRFARNLSECMETIRRLQEWNVEIIFEKEGVDTGQKTNELLLGILAAIAQEESNNLSQNQKWGRKKRYEMGCPCEKASYGFRSCGKNHQWRIEEAEAKRVRLAFYLAGMCCNYTCIRNALNKMEEEENTGKIWNQTPVVNLLRNVAYIGDYLSNKECTVLEESGPKRRKNKGYEDQFYIVGHHEPLVSRELFQKVQELLKRHLLFTQKQYYTEEEKWLMERCMELAGEEQNGRTKG